MSRFLNVPNRAALVVVALPLVAGCQNGFGTQQFDPDLRGLGPGFNTADAARAVTQPRPPADNRGVISYPSYQVALARRGDTVTDVAGRLGLPAGELARYNGLPADAPLREGELVSLPSRVSEPSPATGAIISGPIRPGGTGAIDITTLAGGAIDRAGSGADRPVPPGQIGTEPTRHQVRRGETAYSIARSYSVSVEALAEWNGLGPQVSVREGQYLLIPPIDRARTAAATPSRIETPGSGSAAPEPPSAATPLPAQDERPTTATAAPASPRLANERTAASGGSRLALPADGSIIRAFAAGRNDGIDIGAPAGAPVRAANSGTVAAITTNTDQVPIVVIRHADNLLTVYAGLDAVTVKRGDTVQRGQQIAKVRAGNPSFLHFEVRQGMEALDPAPFLE